MEFINDSFSSKSAQVRALTTQGNLISSIAFRAELTGKVIVSVFTFNFLISLCTSL